MPNISKKMSIVLAVISGIVTAFIFPTRFGGIVFPNFGFLAWFSLIPLFVVIYNAPPRRAFLLTFITGFIYYSISLYWLYTALTRYGKLSMGVSVGLLFLMMVILAAYIAVAPALVSWLKKRVKAPTILLMPLAWVAVELARNYAPCNGFPWNNLAHSQYGYPVLIQIADLVGIYGLTFLIVWVNWLGTEIICSKRMVRVSCHCDPEQSEGEAIPRTGHCEDYSDEATPRTGDRHVGLWPPRDDIKVKIVVTIILFAFLISYGWYRLETIDVHSPRVPTIRTALVQGNIAQDEKWDPDLSEDNLSIYRDYMGQVSEGDVSLAVWPESAFPWLVPIVVNDIEHVELGLDDREGGPWLLFGALSAEGKKEPTLYNSAILVDNGGRIRGRYHKVHLVPFGEYVPYKRLLFFAKKLIAPVGNFKVGKKLEPLSVKGAKIGPLICYEDVFPEVSRGLVRAGSNLLINITNDAWYGWSSAAYQHLAISVFRAVENRRTLLRATNTGVSAVINPLGRIELESDLFSRGLIATSVPLFGGTTIYNRIGDLFAYMCVGIVALLSIVIIFRIKGYGKR